MARCKLPNCPIAKDGKCLEGRKSDCPNLLPDELPSQAGATGQQPVNSLVPMEKLYSGLPLEIEESRVFSRRNRAILVAVTGTRECGKTSLFARFMQMFQEGPIAGYDYADSRTLPRFDQLSWLATVESGATTPGMERSSRLFDNTLLHYTVREQGQNSVPIDLLLNDISGETFPDAVASQVVCEQLFCLRRADHVVVMVDGGALAQRVLRHDHCAKAKNFIQRLLQSNQIGSKTALHLIISKLDELRREGHNEEILESATKLERDFNTLFGSRVAKIHCWRIAARPLDGSMPTKETISHLFATWATSTHRYQSDITAEGAAISHARDFSRFAD